MQSYVCEKEQTDPGIAFVIAVLGVGRVIALFSLPVLSEFQLQFLIWMSYCYNKSAKINSFWTAILKLLIFLILLEYN